MARASNAKDKLGRSIVVGDVIAYSVTAGTGGSDLMFAQVENLVPVIPHPSGEPSHFVREDQLNRSRPTRFYRAGCVVQVRNLYPRRDASGVIDSFRPDTARKSLTHGGFIKVTGLKIEVRA